VRDSYSRAVIRVQTYFPAGHIPIALEVLPDLDANGYEELAVAAFNPADETMYVSVRDARLGHLIADTTIGSPDEPWGLAWVNDINGGDVPELVGLTSGPYTNDIIAKVRDAVTGAAVNDIYLGPSFHPWP
jgi:hypothetical protein